MCPLNNVTATTPTVTVHYATYLDADNDGREDDVFANATLTLTAGTNKIFFMYRIIYPSSDVWSDIGSHTTTSTSLLFEFVIINGAYEEGWYTFEVEIFINNGMNDYYTADSYVFDPPEEDPQFPIGGTVTITSI